MTRKAPAGLTEKTHSFPHKKRVNEENGRTSLGYQHAFQEGKSKSAQEVETEHGNDER